MGRPAKGGISAVTLPRKSTTPTDYPVSQQGSKTTTAPGIGRGRCSFEKAGEAIRTPDIHVGKTHGLQKTVFLFTGFRIECSNRRPC
jgi:hypothetical protein